MHRQLCAGRLAEGEGRAGVVDVVVGEDDQVDVSWLEALLADEPKHRSVAAGVARIDDRKAFIGVIEVGLGTPDPGDWLDHGTQYGLRLFVLNASRTPDAQPE